MKMMAAIATLLMTAGASRADGTHSEKGWELYTWFDLRCSATPQAHSAPNDDSWCAALVAGTNRLKKRGEIEKAAIKWRDLPAALGALRTGEEVAWITTPGAFARPDPRIADPIAAAARQHGLTLTDVARR